MSNAFFVASGGQWRGISGTPATITPPSPPSIVGVTAGDSEVTVAWKPPVNNGGSAITGYQVIVSPGGASSSVGAGVTETTVVGLTNEQEYTAVVKASNSSGQGPASVSTAAFIPSSTAPVIRRDATNTGVLGVYDSSLGRYLTYSDLTTYTGSINLATEGTTLYRQDIVLTDNPLIISANNITLSQCRIRWPAGTSGPNVIRRSYSFIPTGFVMDDCEVNGQGTPRTAGVYPSGSAPSCILGSGWGYTLNRCNLLGSNDIIDPSGNASGSPVIIRDSYLHDPIHTVGSNDTQVSHNDILQLAGNGTAGGVIIQRSTLDGYTPTQPVFYTSSCTTYDGITSGSVVSNFVLEDCYLQGAGYAVRLRSTNTTAVYRRNRFGLHILYGPKANTAAPGITWENNNVWDVAGTTDYGQAVLAGEIIT